MNLVQKMTMILALVGATTLGGVALAQPAHAAPSCDIKTGGLAGAAKCAQGDGQQDSLEGDGGVFKQVTNVLLFVIGAVAVIMLVFGGVRYTVSGGDAKQVEAAKNTILYAIIGIVVAILAYAIVNFVISGLSA